MLLQECLNLLSMMLIMVYKHMNKFLVCIVAIVYRKLCGAVKLFIQQLKQLPPRSDCIFNKSIKTRI